MAQFDDLVSKYRNLTYGRLASNNPSAIKSLLETTDKSISNPQYFGNINPNQQQYLDTPSGLIAQNRFRIDPQTGIPIFETPASESIKSASGTYDPNIDYGDPGYAGVIPEDPINTELVTGQIAENRGGGGAGQERDRQGIQSGLERIGGMNLKINPVSGKIEVLDPNSLASNFLTDYSAIQKFTPAGMISGLLGQSDYGNQLDRIRSQYGDAIADEIAATVQESYRTGYAPSGVLSSGLQPGDKVKVGNTPGFINSQGNFQGGTPIGEISTGTEDDKVKTKTKPDNDSKGEGQNKESSETSGNDEGTMGDDQRKSGGDPDGSKKIICTMMNESYGFGSYRNAIWLKYSRDHLLPEHEIGYHKIFLPLVAHAKGKGLSNYIVKIVIEHLTRHRTIDCKQEMRGKKRHTLGRIYRAIFEPLCYIVGKYGK
tara:strand:+ start:881 stop:2167 length:1287 start_codon:yes stop_codon:yes gene_type:complete